MNEYKIVNATQLDNDLKDVADVIRNKSGASDFFEFPEGFKEAIENISASTNEEFEALIARNIEQLSAAHFGSLTFIGNSAFKSCISLKTVNFSSAIELIGNQAFADCYSLNNLVIPSNIKTITYAAFQNCTELNALTLNEGLEFIGNSAFDNCNILESLTFPSTIKTIENLAFNRCLFLKTVTFEGTPTDIARGVFSDCSNLGLIYVPWSENDPINVNAPWGAPDDVVIVYGGDSGESYTNIVPTTIDETGAIYNGTGYKDGYSLIGNNGEEYEDSPSVVTGYFPVIVTDIVRFSSDATIDIDFSCIALYNENFEFVGNITDIDTAFTIDENIVTWNIPVSDDKIIFSHNEKIYAKCSVRGLDIDATGEGLIITLNENIS